MQAQTFSRAQCLAAQFCRGSSLRSKQAAHLSRVQHSSCRTADCTAARSSKCSPRRQLTTTRAESGNGASPAPSGLSIDLRGIARSLGTLVFRYLAIPLTCAVVQGRKRSLLVLRTIRHVDVCRDGLLLTSAIPQGIVFTRCCAGLWLGYCQGARRGRRRDFAGCVGEHFMLWFSCWRCQLI